MEKPKKIKIYDRKRKIKQLIQDCPGKYDYVGLSKEFGISERTIRSDVAALRDDGILVKVNNGKYYLEKDGLVSKPELQDKSGKLWRLITLLGIIRNSPLLMNTDKLVNWLVEMMGESANKSAGKSLDSSVREDLNELVVDGYLKKVDGQRFAPGPRLLPDTVLKEERLEFVLRKLDAVENTYPDQIAIQKLKSKIASMLNSQPGDDVSRLLERTMVVGRLPVNNHRVRVVKEKVEQALLGRFKISFTYGTKTQTRKKVIPLGLIYNWFVDDWYLIGRSGRSVQGYPCSRIIDLNIILNETYIYPDDFSRAANYGLAWGVDRNKIHQLRVRFDNVYNVAEKVKRTVENRVRENDGNGWEITGDELVYTDQVTGLDELRSWLRRFGSSVEVLEPLELRQRIRQTAAKTLENYGLKVEELS